MIIVCDGCARELRDDVHYVTADGRPARYCGECEVIYKDWLSTLQQEENRLNALLDAFISSSRYHVPLRLVPQDLPKRLDRLGEMVLG